MGRLADWQRNRWAEERPAVRIKGRQEGRLVGEQVGKRWVGRLAG